MTGGHSYTLLFTIIAAAAGISGCSLPIYSETDVEIESEKQFEEMKQQNSGSISASTVGYVTCVAEAIIEQLEDPYASKDWEVVVFDRPSANAFAMAGGKIGVHTGILEVASTQDQLGAVLGHEVAHVTEQHTVERINREITTQVAVVGGAAAIGGGGAGDLLQLGAQLALSKPYGRRQESEADAVGLIYSADAGFDPRESVQLWKNMEENSKGAPPEFLSTHPSPDTRIGDLIEQLPEALTRFNQAKAEGRRPNCGP